MDDTAFTLDADALDPGEVASQIEAACRAMESVYEEHGHYPRVTVGRRWSGHNPSISGELAHPAAYRWYLARELRRLLDRGASIRIEASRPRIGLDAPDYLERIDEHDLDITRKKLFLCAPERIEVSVERIEHYTGTRVDDVQRHVLLTNYDMHLDAFEAMFPGCVRSAGTVQMPACHEVREDNAGITIVNIGVGPSNAKNFTDHLAVLRPDTMIMVGHCAGIRNHQEIGDFVLASGYMRADRVLDDRLPMAVPVAPIFLLNQYLARTLDEARLDYRIGTVYTTADRNWELDLGRTRPDLRASRSVAIDMESATVAANGFRYRIPNATLLCVSDKPLHGKPKRPRQAQDFYRDTATRHLQVAVDTLERIHADWPSGLPNASIRAPDEPLMGGPPD